jgi:hypothetical protein
VALSLCFGVHHRRVDFLPFLIGEADVLFGEGVGEIARLQIRYVDGRHQIKQDTIGSSARTQLDAITAAQLVEHIRILVIASNSDSIFNRQQLLEVPGYYKLGLG